MKTNNIYFSKHYTHRILFLIFTCLLFGTYSCSSKKESYLEGNQTTVRINLSGTSFNTNKNLTSSSNKFKTENLKQTIVPFSDSLQMEVAVLPHNSMGNKPVLASSSKMAATISNSPLAAGVKYAVLVYDEAGSFVMEKTLAQGDAGDALNLVLDAGQSYTFIAISTDSNTDVPVVSNKASLATASLNQISADLMYFKTTMTLTHGLNNLNVILRHMFSEIDVTLELKDNVNGTFEGISNFGLSPVQESANLKLSDGTLTYNASSNGQPAYFTFNNESSLGLRTIKSDKAITVISPLINNAQFTYDIRISGGISETGKVSTEIPILPGQKYAVVVRIGKISITIDPPEQDDEW